MTISYTTNFLLPKLSDGGGNWGAVFNAMLDTVDLETKAAQSPLVSLIFNQTLINRLNGEIVLQHYQL